MLQGTRAVVVNWRDLQHSLAGGSERYAWEAALALRAAGAEVEFLTARDEGQAAEDLHDGIRIRRRGRQFSFYFWTLLRLLSLRLRGRAPDVVVDPENGIPSFSPLVLGRRTAVVLVVHHVHQEQFRTYFPRPLAAFGRFLEGRAMPRVYRGRPTVVVSRSTEAEMRRQLGWRGPTVLIPNGTVGAPPGAGDDGRDPHRLVVLGRMARHKRIDRVLAAVARVRPDRPGLHLDVIGTGPIAAELDDLAARLLPAGAVTLHGFLPEADKARLLGSAWLHLCGSDAEGWGQVVIEAAAYGVPTVAREVPGLRDSVRDGDTGWLVPDPASTEGVADALEAGLRRALDALDDPGEGARVRAACRRWAAGFTWERMHDQLVDVVAAEVDRRARQPGQPGQPGRSTTR